MSSCQPDPNFTDVNRNLSITFSRFGSRSRVFSSQRCFWRIWTAPFMVWWQFTRTKSIWPQLIFFLKFLKYCWPYELYFAFRFHSYLPGYLESTNSYSRGFKWLWMAHESKLTGIFLPSLKLTRKTKWKRSQSEFPIESSVPLLEKVTPISLFMSLVIHV